MRATTKKADMSRYVTKANLASEVLVIFIVLVLVTIGSTCTWTLFGILIGQFLKTENRLRLFNTVMASLLLASLLPVLLG